MGDDELLQAGREVGADLGDEVYVLVRSDQEHVLGVDDALVIIGTMLLGAYLKGVSASVTGRMEKYGKDTGSWLMDRIEDLLRAGDPNRAAAELREAADDAQQRVSEGGAAAPAEEAASGFRMVLEQTGMSPDEAAEITVRVRAQGQLLLARG